MLRITGLALASFLLLGGTADAQRSRVGVYPDWETNKHLSLANEYEFEAYTPKNAFKSIDYPTFINNEQAKKSYDFNEVAVIVSVGREHKAYPLSMLLYHPVINDRIGGKAIAVTYCPLTDAVNVWRRDFVHKGMPREIDFSVSGLLRNSNTVLYDRVSESWWQQFTGKAMVGEFAGISLEPISSIRMTMGDFWNAYPYGLAVSPKAKDPVIPYGTTPYYKYDQAFREKPLFLRHMPDSPLMAMERVVGIEIIGKHIVYPFSEIEKMGALNDKPMDMFVTIFYQEGVKSALDEKDISKSKSIGAIAAYSAFQSGQLLTFKKEGKLFKDEETGSLWRFDGTCIDGALKGEKLKPLKSQNSFAFAQMVFYPKSLIYNINW
ncbi:DUF3179 domain-containing protein [Limibacter armeniacum]|uniref:DUF3179 domain-containing protein n=1 Tax=Limibacter armeniacum TaxID=466084 RepID=UPI002FE59D2B